jgi:hypothetical protein
VRGEPVLRGPAIAVECGPALGAWQAALHATIFDRYRRAS